MLKAMIPSILSATVAAAGLAPAASAQNALGDGTALDSNLNVEGTRNLPQAGSNYGLRNLLVTRNVVAGRGFRDAVGYRAADDFRGATGSDDLFDFRADSALSALNIVNVGRGWQSISVGQDVGIMAYRRATVGATLPTIPQGPPLGAPAQYGQILEAEARLDRALLDYQSNGRLLMTDSRPESLAYFTTPDGGVIQITASALRGLRMGPLDQDPTQIGLTYFDRARLLDQALAEGELSVVAGAPFDLDVHRLLNAQAPSGPEAPGAASESSLLNTVPMSYQDMIRSMAEPAPGTNAEEAARRLSEQMLRTTQWLRGGEEPAESEGQPPQTPQIPQTLPGITPGPTQPEFAPPQPPATGETVRVPLEESAHGGMQVEGSDPHEPVKLPDNVTLEMLRHGRVLDTLATDDDERFAEIMRAGEERLRGGEFFLAERQFVRANSFHPNHPMALAGLANAQLGAGILASASVSLRNLFVNRPEMIDVEYAPGLLPSEERLRETVMALERRLEGERRTSGAALLLAYIGRQTGDRDMMQRGIELMAQIDGDDPLVPVLRTVWLEGSREQSPEK